MASIAVAGLGRAALRGARARLGMACATASSPSCSARRSLSTGDDIEEFLDKHLSKESNTPGTPKQSIATTRRESLSLYRDILRFSRFFTWTDNNGVPFRWDAFPSLSLFLSRPPRSTNTPGLAC